MSAETKAEVFAALFEAWDIAYLGLEMEFGEDENPTRAEQVAAWRARYETAT